MTTSNESNPNPRQSSESSMEGARSSAHRLSEQAKQQAMAQFNQGRDTITDGIEKVAHAAKAAASDLQQHDGEGLSEYVTEMADNISAFANSLRGKNIDQLVRDASDIARRNPALFIAGSVAVGFGLSRFAKASSSPEAPDFDSASQSSQSTNPYTSDSEPDWLSSDETPQNPSIAPDPWADDVDDTSPGGYRYE